MPIATATTIIVIIVYILLRAVSRTGELLHKTFHGNGGDRTNNGGASLLPLRNARLCPSRNQQMTAVRVANVTEGELEGRWGRIPTKGEGFPSNLAGSSHKEGPF
jgi:hypothetical protein